MKKFLILIVSILFLTNLYADNLEIFQFNSEELDTLKVRKIRGAKNLTHYSLGNNTKGSFLRAESEDGGSGLGKEVSVDLDKTPFLNITWKIEKDLSGINEKSKKEHDFAARFFVVKKTGLTPLSNKAINYVFSSNEEIGEFWTSPYTKSSIDYVLSSTKNTLNEWVTVKTNVKEDYKKLHNLDVDMLDGVAIMADTDQSKKQSISYFQNIYFSAN